MRRQFQLAGVEEEQLAGRGLTWETVIENNTRWIIFHQYPIPEGYNYRVVNAALIIPPSYPDEQIDMVYFFPALALTNGKPIGALSPCQLDGNQYQRWSRHRKQDEWRPGLDNVYTHLLQVDSWLERELKK